MLSSTKSRRIFNIICVSLAIAMMGYGFFLRIEKKALDSNPKHKSHSEYVMQSSDTIDKQFDWSEEYSEPNE